MKELLLKLVRSDRKHLDGALCFFRLFAGFLMLTHGWAKLSSFSTLATTFPDPLGVSSIVSLILILFCRSRMFIMYYIRVYDPFSNFTPDIWDANGYFYHPRQ